MKITPFNFNTTSSIRFGSGLSKDLAKDVSKILGSKILFITDKGLMSLGLTAPTIKELNTTSSVEIFDNVEADPSLKTLQSAISVGN